LTERSVDRPVDAPPLVHRGPAAQGLPRHVAIIMDGNRRWAKAQGRDELDGHTAGTEALRGVITRAAELGIEHLTVYAFSRENWGRDDREVNQLFALLAQTIERETATLVSNGIAVDFLGRLQELPADAAQRIQRACDATAAGRSMRLHVAFNYGGRTELVDAVRAIVRSRVEPEQVDEETISGALYTRGIPDPDLLIRTGGEERLSNFLLWQTAYTELVTWPGLWPDFSGADLESAMRAYAARTRRFGR
jgi:undecaprenyl diphosphate synthase